MLTKLSPPENQKKKPIRDTDEYGLTGWTEGEALNASETAFKQWCDYRGSGQTEPRQILGAVRDFIDRHGESRFSPIDANESQPLVRDRAGG